MVKGSPATNIADIERLEIVFKDALYCLPLTAHCFEITDCDLKDSNSFRVNWNIKSEGKRSRLRFTA